MAEGCYSGGSTVPKPGGSPWLGMEDTELAMAAQHKLFFCFASSEASAAASADLRVYAYASFLLTYDPSTSIIWERFVTPSGFNVEPETGLVALNPTVPTPTTVTTLRTSSHVFAREYATCYFRGASVGPCAAIVNSDYYNAYPFPYPGKYHHTLVLSGGGVLDGGQAVVTGPAPVSTIPALGSAIVFE